MRMSLTLVKGRERRGKDFFLSCTSKKGHPPLMTSLTSQGNNHLSPSFPLLPGSHPPFHVCGHLDVQDEEYKCYPHPSGKIQTLPFTAPTHKIEYNTKFTISIINLRPLEESLICRSRGVVFLHTEVAVVGAPVPGQYLPHPRGFCSKNPESLKLC